MSWEAQGRMSTGNCSTTPLGIGGVFTGSWDRVLGQGMAVVTVLADQPSAVDGLAFDIGAADAAGAPVLIRTLSSGVLANVGRAFNVNVRGLFFRIRYTNGGVAQGSFNLCCHFQAGSGIITEPLDGSMTTENLAQRVRAVLTREDAGTFTNIGATNPLPVEPRQYEGKTVSRIVVAQGAAGTTVLAAASPSNKHKVVGATLTLDSKGTLQFTDGAGNLTGAMNLPADGGFVWAVNPRSPMLETSVVNTSLNLVTVGGKAQGVVIIVTEP